MARSFNGSSSKIVCTGPLNTEFNQPFSAAAWITLASGAAVIEEEIVNNLDSGNNFRGWSLQWEGTGVGGSNSFAFYVISNFGASNYYVTKSLGHTAFDGDGKYHHIAATYDGSGGTSGMGGSPKLYVDGVQEWATNAGVAVTATAINSIPLQIGIRNNATDFFKGNLAEIGAWRCILSPQEIYALAKGARVSAVRPGALVCDIRLDGYDDITDFSRTRNIAVQTATTLVTGPPLISPTPIRVVNTQLDLGSFIAPAPLSFTLMPQIVT